MTNAILSMIEENVVDSSVCEEACEGSTCDCDDGGECMCDSECY